jgi:hypothetical protein
MLSRLENDVLGNAAGLEALDGALTRATDALLKRKNKKRLIIDLDSTEDPAHGKQEGVAYNGHFAKNCFHPLFCFTSDGDCLRAKLRPGNVHSADGVLEFIRPIVERYRGWFKLFWFRGDAAFANPETYEYCEFTVIRPTRVQDADSELLVQVKTTPGHVPDGPQLPELVDGRAGEATGDKAYDSEANHAHLAAAGVASGLIRRRRLPGRPRLSRRERPKIERKFAEGKNRHGLARARYWGLAKVSIQVFMVALVSNLKRLVKLILGGVGAGKPAYAA